jgi:hypothetical protein
MITPDEIREMLKGKPFRPLRFFLSDGSKHDVPHPEFAWVFGGRIFIGTPAKGPAVFGVPAGGLVKEISILHVTRVEELKRSKPKKAAK